MTEPEFHKAKLILDSREKMPGLEKNFKALGYDVVRDAMPFGDICVPEASILIERKTITDLIGSISSKRLMIQLEGILEQDVEHKVLLIENTFMRDWIKGKVKIYAGRFFLPTFMHPKSMSNLLWSYQKRGILILQSSGVFDSSALVSSIIQNELKEEKTPFNLIFKEKAETLEEQKTRLIVNLPGVSVERGKALLGFYQNDVMKALLDVQNWDKNVDGIGKKTREDCQKVLAGE